jgi:hypothetical protein
MKRTIFVKHTDNTMDSQMCPFIFELLSHYIYLPSPFQVESSVPSSPGGAPAGGAPEEEVEEEVEAPVGSNPEKPAEEEGTSLYYNQES